MSPQEWAAFAAELAHGFRGTFGAASPDDAEGMAQEATYRRHLAHVDYDIAAAAVGLLVRDGQVWLPTPGELVAAVDRITRRTVAPFASALSDVLRLAREHRPVVPPYPGRAWREGERSALVAQADRVAHAELVAAVSAELGEGAARWVDARGRAGLLGEALDGEHAGAVRHRLLDEYRQYVEQAEEDRKVGLAVAQTQRALEGRPRGLRQITDTQGT